MLSNRWARKSWMLFPKASWLNSPAPWSLRVNGKIVAVEPKQGFATITRQWKDGDVVTLDLPMPVRRVAGNPKIAATRGQVALERGPVVYAFEGVDNDGTVFDTVLPATEQPVEPVASNAYAPVPSPPVATAVPVVPNVTEVGAVTVTALCAAFASVTVFGPSDTGPR